MSEIELFFIDGGPFMRPIALFGLMNLGLILVNILLANKRLAFIHS